MPLQHQHLPPRPPRLESAPGWLMACGCLLFAAGWTSPGSAAAGPQTAPPSQGGSISFTPPVYGDSDGNRDLIAVTGPDQTGSGVLYVIDTTSKQLACYQAVGGSGSQTGLRFIGARRIDLDLQVIGYNDRSQESYEELERRFDRLEVDPVIDPDSGEPRK